jgi:hypothetical protein
VYRKDYIDSDFGICFTVKLYESEKTKVGDSWRHTKITLNPQSFNNDYEDILLQEEELSEFKVVGEFVEVLK